MEFLLPRDSDVVITADRGGLGVNALSFDFDGDGQDDLAVSNAAGIDIVSGKDLNSEGSLSSKSMMRVEKGDNLAFGDLNGDGKKDLIVQQIASYGAAKVCVFFGGKAHPPVVDLEVEGGDLTLLGISSQNTTYFGTALAVGDIDEDGIDDLAIGSPSADPLGRTDVGEVYVVKGQRTFPSPVVSVSTGNLLTRFYGVSGRYLGSRLQIVDVNGDNKKDLLISAPPGRDVNPPFMVYVLHSRPQWEASYDFLSESPNLLLLSNNPGINMIEFVESPSSPLGKNEPLVFLSRGSWWIPLAEMLGYVPLSAFASNGTVSLDSVTSVGNSLHVTKGGMRDADGDDIPDILSPRRLILTTEWGVGVSTSASSIEFYTTAEMTGTVFGDVNGDRRADAILLESYPSGGGWGYGAIHVIYGHRPLRDPSVRVGMSSSNSSRVVLELSVGGEPTEMKISEDISDSRRDQWIPFQRAFRTNWTSAEGLKTVRAKFRNAVGRESAEASAQGTLSVASEGMVVVNNWVREGQRAVIEYRVVGPTRFRVRVLSPSGLDLMTVAEGSATGGIEKWEWDGRNAAGHRVAAGIYVLLFDVNGRMEKMRVVVEW